MSKHQFLRWYEVLMVQLLVRSPRVQGILVRSAEESLAWVLHKPSAGQIARELLERSYRA